MSTDSRASSDEEDHLGAGGKLVRRCRRDPRPAPYRRPEEGERRGWLSGLVAGAGRLLSSVFRPGGGGGGAESSESEGEGSEGDVDIRDNHDVNQGETGQELTEDQGVGCEHVASKSKLVIEQLIQKENFTRGESDRLIEIIHSRVIDSPMTNGLPSTSFYGNIIYPGSFLEQVNTPVLCDKAVMEARKWVEEKRSAINSKAAQNSGASTLDAAVYSRDCKNNKGSPVGMAKSYMQALPPCLSPMRTSGFRTPSIRTCSDKLGSLHAPSSSGLSSLQDLKRKYDSAGAFDDLNTTRSRQQKTSENVTVSPGFEQLESMTNTSPHEHPRTLDGEVPEPNPAINESDVRVTCSPEAVASIPAEFVNKADHGNAVNSSEDFSHADLHHGSVTSTPPSKSKDQMEVASSQQEILVTEKNQDLEEIAPRNELFGNVSTEETNLDSLHKDNKGLVEDFMNAEPISMVPENDNPTLPGGTSETVDVTDIGNSYRPGGPGQEKFEREDNSQPHSSAVPKVVHSDARASHVDLVDEEIIGSASASTTDGVHSVPSSSLAGEKAATDSDMATATPADNGAVDHRNTGNNLQKASAKPSRRTSPPIRRMSPRKASVSTSPMQVKKTVRGRSRGRGRGRGK